MKMNLLEINEAAVALCHQVWNRVVVVLRIALVCFCFSALCCVYLVVFFLQVPSDLSHLCGRQLDAAGWG